MTELLIDGYRRYTQTTRLAGSGLRKTFLEVLAVTVFLWNKEPNNHTALNLRFQIGQIVLKYCICHLFLFCLQICFKYIFETEPKET